MHRVRREDLRNMSADEGASIATTHRYGLTLIKHDDEENHDENRVRFRSLHPFQPFHIGDELAPYDGFAMGQRLAVTRVVRFVSSDGDEVLDDVIVYFETPRASLRSV